MEVYNPESEESCQLQDLRMGRREARMCGLLLCGGDDNSEGGDACHIWTDFTRQGSLALTSPQSLLGN